MKRLLLLLVLLLFIFPSVTRNAETYDPYLLVKIIRFETHHDPFVRNLLGCEADGPIDKSHCLQARAKVDYGEFGKARKAAADLYDLKIPE